MKVSELIKRLQAWIDVNNGPPLARKNGDMEVVARLAKEYREITGVAYEHDRANVAEVNQFLVIEVEVPIPAGYAESKIAARPYYRAMQQLSE